ncbi:MAG: roadblock/LC7 domain-containing protein [Gaiellaceae bacterium MAG52_C11]|nr:roadblock/LC7 domain-containing protein [Candidatus Gaiellasilicea maunaloa]
MDTESALADLSEISSQIESAVIFDSAGAVLGSTGSDETRSNRLVRTALDLVAAAEQLAPSHAGPGQDRRLTQIEGSLREGSVFVVTGDERSIAATTTPEPTSGLVFYDLRTCLRSLAPQSREPGPNESEPKESEPKEPAPKPRRSRKKKVEPDA